MIKPLNGNNSYYIVNVNPEKITENINPDESDDSNETEQNITISKHPVQLKNSSNQLSFDREKMYDFQKNWKGFILKLKQFKCS